MIRTLCLFLGLASLTLLGCKKAETTTPPDGHAEEHAEEGDEHGDFEGREVVDNWSAKTGDVTTCPVSGDKFEVAENSDRFDYQGHTFVFCCGGCLNKAQADPAKYLDGMVEQAGGPATDPEPTEGDAVDDT